MSNFCSECGEQVFGEKCEQHPEATIGAFNKVAPRPYPYVRACTEKGWNWSPVKVVLQQDLEHEPELVQAGEYFSIVRPGRERWPLGIVSDHRRIVGHVETRAAIEGSCSASVRFSGAQMVGIGTQMIHAYEILHASSALNNCASAEEFASLAADNSVDGHFVGSKLLVTNDHSGSGSMQASIVIYVGNRAIGSVVFSKAMHVSTQPERWQGDIDAMIEKSILVQDAVLTLLRAAAARILTDEDREWFKNSKGMVVKDAKTALDALVAYANGFAQRITWGVWSRRLGSVGIDAVCELLGRAEYGTPIDEAYGYVQTRSSDGAILKGRYVFGGPRPVTAKEVAA